MEQQNILLNFVNNTPPHIKMLCPYCVTTCCFEFIYYQLKSCEMRESSCPNCHEFIIERRHITIHLKKRPLNGLERKEIKGKWILIYPQKKNICIDERIPEEIKADLNEAYSIASFSPKSAAVIARRVLERILEKYIIQKKLRNIDELIKASENYISTKVFTLLNAARIFGKFGAHVKENMCTEEILNIEESEALSAIAIVNELAEEWFIHREELFRMKKQADTKDQLAKTKSNNV